MIRTFALAGILASALALPAAAADAANSRDFTAKLSAQAHQTQLRNIAAGRGYIVTSAFSQSGSGHWVASAMKDGKVTTIAVKMPPRDLPALIN